jgi:TolB-like protein/DNA-binding winged helix-turn-helix (wHTH) protein/Tfp pilus assembly protein PilF
MEIQMAGGKEVPAPGSDETKVIRGSFGRADPPRHGPTLRFGRFELDLDNEELRRNGHAVKLQDQPLRVLSLLASQAGRIVRREEIREAVWGPDTFVDFEQGINHCIRQLRQVLGDEADAPRYIETLPRKGYRFIAPIEESPDRGGAEALPPAGASGEPGEQPRAAGAPAAAEAGSDPGVTAATAGARGPASGRRVAWASAVIAIVAGAAAAGLLMRPDTGIAPPPADRPVLAVLPFANMTGDAGNDYLADGLTEELITQLGRSYSRRLGVIARTSVIAFALDPPPADEIGRRLGADYLLEGSIRSSAERVRVTAQLIRASDQSYLWATSYDRPLTDLIEVQSEVSRRISEALALQILPPADRDALKSATHPEAYELSLKASFLLNRGKPGDAREALDDLERAVAIDPGFARGWSLLSEAWRSQPLPGAQTNPRAREAALKALSLDDSLEDAWLRLALIRFYRDLDPEGARQAFERAIESHPDFAVAHHQFAAYWTVRGRHDLAIASMKRALALDPLSPDVNADVGWYYYYARKYDEAIAASRKTLEITPRFVWAHRSLILSCLAKGDLRCAVEAGRAEMIGYKVRDELVAAVDPEHPEEGMRAYWIWDLGRWERSAVKERAQPTVVGLIYAALGYEEAALFTLEHAFEERVGWMTPFLRVDPLADPLRDNPRFQALLERIEATGSARASL